MAGLPNLKIAPQPPIVGSGSPTVGIQAAATATPDRVRSLQQTDDHKPGIKKLLADAILKTDRFARDPGGRLYRFEKGAYRAAGDVSVKRRVKSLLETWELTGEWSSHLANEVVEYIQVDAPELWERSPFDVLNVRNGLLTVNTGDLRPHSPDFLSPIQLPVAYEPDATCPHWDKFVGEMFPSDAHDLAYELPAWLMLPDVSIQKAVLFVGEGANGKSTYLTALRAFLGSHNVSGVSLHKLESDRFAAARLVGKLANICPDLPSHHLEGTSIFKQITGGDTVTAEYKFKDSFDYLPSARLVFSANECPRSSDAAHAFFRRWIVVPFLRTLEHSEQIPRTELDARLAAPGELSGVLNRALLALRVIRSRGGLTESPSMRAAWGDFLATTDPLAIWLDQTTSGNSDAVVTKHALVASHNAAATVSGRPTMTAAGFGRALKRLKPGIQEAQRTVDGELQWVWLGLALRE